MKYTLADVRRMTDDTITPEVAGSVLGTSGEYIRLAARDRKYRELLGFPVIVIKSRTKIPREAFILAMEGKLQTGAAAGGRK